MPSCSPQQATDLVEDVPHAVDFVTIQNPFTEASHGVAWSLLPGTGCQNSINKM